MNSELIQGCRQHHPESQRRFFKWLAPVMMTVCRRYAPDRAAAEDILQEAFVKVFRHFDRYQPDKSPVEAWVRRIVVNTAIEHWRKWQKQYVLITEDNIPDQFSDPGGAMQLEAEDILALIQRLPPGFKMVFNLYAVEGYSHAEIAQLLNITESASRSQLARARKQLQEMLSLQNSATDGTF